MVNAKPTVSKSLNVAESVEDGERVSVFQYADTVVHAGRGREDIKILTDGYDFLGHCAYFLRASTGCRRITRSYTCRSSLAMRAAVKRFSNASRQRTRLSSGTRRTASAASSKPLTMK